MPAFLLCATLSLYGQPLPDIFTDNGDIGAVKIAGSSIYDSGEQSYTLSGSGTNMWFEKDEFFMTWRKISVDFTIRADAHFIGEGVDPHRKLGLIVRTGLDSDDAYADVAVHGDGLTSLQYRRSKGDSTKEVRSTITAPDVLQLTREGNTYRMSVARFGDLFASEEIELDLGEEVYVGLFICAHNPDVSETAVFRNVRIVIPPGPDHTPYQDYLGSNLEIMDVHSGHRKILHRSPESLQAPNWTLDGKYLIYNHNGLLYNFNLATNTPVVLNTDFANRNNNDHVLSFDGSMLGISHHSADHDGESIIYTLPANGGIPKLITPLGPSYLHGWSPDGKYLTYTARRDGDYDIYIIPSDGGDEIRLTNTKGLDDGSEYTPDGKYIYFNSVRSGTMQIWRMKADGSDQEQITDDGLNNWFPHISPDGQWIVFLSYNQDVAPGDHPFYKHVYLRMMPISGDSPKVIAYLFGGQGTINVPSWSPDSKRIAFVSNSDLPLE